MPFKTEEEKRQYILDHKFLFDALNKNKTLHKRKSSLSNPRLWDLEFVKICYMK